ncbi:MAG: gamma-glutamyltransferase [Bryobacteraceae bacterium]
MAEETAISSTADAAIAADAVISVIEPMMNGVGGDLFAIIYEAKTGKVYSLNARRICF